MTNKSTCLIFILFRLTNKLHIYFSVDVFSQVLIKKFSNYFLLVTSLNIPVFEKATTPKKVRKFDIFDFDIDFGFSYKLMDFQLQPIINEKPSGKLMELSLYY